MLPLVEGSIRRHAADELYRAGACEQIAAIVDALFIEPQYIHGDVALVGTGDSFGEVAIISDDCMKTPIILRRDITSVTAIELFEISAPPFAPHEPVVLYPHTSIQEFSMRSAQYSSFDWIFMLRMNALHDKANDGILDDISRVLKQGGVFVASGEHRALPYFQQHPMLELQQTVYLDSVNGGYPFVEHHMGFVATKK